MYKDFYKGKKVLVLGHTGFKGSWLTKWLVELGAEVTGFSLYLPSEPCLFTEMELEKEITHIVGDINDYDALEDAFFSTNPEIVFHLAARPIVRECFDNPRMAFQTNTLGFINVMECLRTCESVKSSVLITSDKCYENVEWNYGYRETDRLGGVDPYSASKACAEIAFSSYFRSFLSHIDRLKVATARAGNVIGGGDWADKRIIPDAVRSWSNQEAVGLRSPHATRPWQHVLEPLSGYLWLGQQLMENPEINGESYNFGPRTGKQKTVEDLIVELSKTWINAKYENLSEGQAKKEAGLLQLCCDKALNELEWQAVLHFEETSEFTARWYKEFYDKSNVKELTLGQIKQYEAVALDRGVEWAR